MVSNSSVSDSQMAFPGSTLKGVCPNLEGTMQARSESGSERRNTIYRFHTLLELLDHYSEFLSAPQMEAVIRDSAKVFVERDWATDQVTRLQYIKKCEYLMETRVAMKEATLKHGLAE